MRRRKMQEKGLHKHIGENQYTYRYIVVATKGTYRVEARGVRGPLLAAELSVVAGGCSHAMVGAQLW